MRGLGYFISIISVILLGLVAWPKPEDPKWHLPALLAGMATSITGMLLRWAASRKQLHELHALEKRTSLR
jgi:hypothetical protein